MCRDFPCILLTDSILIFAIVKPDDVESEGAEEEEMEVDDDNNEEVRVS